ncbi:dimethyl sulfoxide reductase anchor subunit family protein [Sporomusa acidovorans]|uniref:Anaerobic dimethyl sulfoxide reductase chain C n=1 Tax=Sporomusa acidovorans (strain ATCC 49682 / DSM 3132 / Mol) TaxID=1123286 RepID=A0ABZ3J950_SPOA4|nr:DmsC/YnfH family molybdoenzyme membrane anchor subunit [Sporomusa acidovorans]OZC15980.1 anaerobic dimethyl sulfoxide reductase chain C [Sporomusa acidovorans DSM 3132]SDD91163.1 anaerobic dimethyl sulfoxide reductase subunit C (DMSO reductase anchor subunit) [Sporomusa acidovorans]
MGNELPLVVFTVLSQLAVGILIMSQIVGERIARNKKRLYAWALGITAVSMLVAMSHLGDPIGAYRALANAGSSWLSRENIFLGAFLLCVVVMVLKVRRDETAAIGKLGWIGAILGLCAVISTGNVYYYSSIPAWTSLYTYIAFFSAMLILGNSFLVMLLDFTKDQVLRPVKIIVFSNGLLFVIQLAYFVPYLGYLNAVSSLSAGFITDRMGPWLLGQSLLLLGIMGTGYAAYTAKKLQNVPKNINVWFASGFVLAIIGITIGRYLFYAGGMPMW